MTITSRNATVETGSKVRRYAKTKSQEALKPIHQQTIRRLIINVSEIDNKSYSI